jgi:hypothetical protein
MRIDKPEKKRKFDLILNTDHPHCNLGQRITLYNDCSLEILLKNGVQLQLPYPFCNPRPAFAQISDTVQSFKRGGWGREGLR